MTSCTEGFHYALVSQGALHGRPCPATVEPVCDHHRDRPHQLSLTAVVVDASGHLVGQRRFVVNAGTFGELMK
ncbi:hypothetical protein GCM10029978_065840 [Actinoallomurus acanthiterrae]